MKELKFDLIFSNKLNCLKCNKNSFPFFYKLKNSSEFFHVECYNNNINNNTNNINNNNKNNKIKKKQLEEELNKLNLGNEKNSFDIKNFKSWINDTKIIKNISSNTIKNLGINIKNNLFISRNNLNLNRKLKINEKLKLNNTFKKNNKIDKNDYEKFWREINNDYFIYKNYNKIKNSILTGNDYQKYKNNNLSNDYLKLLLNEKDDEKINFLFNNNFKKNKNLLITWDKRNNFDLNKYNFDINNDYIIKENNNENFDFNHKFYKNKFNKKENIIIGKNDLQDFKFDYIVLTNFEVKMLKYIENYRINNNNNNNFKISEVFKLIEDEKSIFHNKIEKNLEKIVESKEIENINEENKKHNFYIKINKNILTLWKFNTFINNMINGQKSKNFEDYKYKFKKKKEKENSVEPDCMICFCGTFSFCNPIIYCSKCNNSFHQSCYLLEKIPNEEFFCDICIEKKNNEKNVENIRCNLCFNTSLSLKKIKNLFYHPICLIANNWLKYYFFNNVELSNSKRSSVNKICSICKKNKGLINSCSKCNSVNFHFLCGFLKGYQTDLFFKENSNLLNKSLFQKLKFIKDYSINELTILNKDFKKYFLLKLNMNIFCWDCIDKNYDYKKQDYLRRYSINYNKLMLENQNKFLKELFNYDI